jgi:hypothetical protein
VRRHRSAWWISTDALTTVDSVHRDARLLKGKALASLRRSARAVNDFDDDGRMSTVLLHLQHAFEMLLKAALVEKNVQVFDKRLGRSIGFEKCVSVGAEKLQLDAEQRGLLRAIDALRDDEQHFLGELNEGLLYLHVRGGVTLFADVLERQFGEKLAEHLPGRVLPISTDPPGDFDVLLDEQYTQIASLLRPGKRRRTEARAQIRALLAMEAHVVEDVLVTEKDVNRVEKAIKSGRARREVFSTAWGRWHIRRGWRGDGDGSVLEARGCTRSVRPRRRSQGRRRRPRDRSPAEVLHVDSRTRGEVRPYPATRPCATPAPRH